MSDRDGLFDDFDDFDDDFDDFDEIDSILDDLESLTNDHNFVDGFDGFGLLDRLDDDGDSDSDSDSDGDGGGAGDGDGDGAGSVDSVEAGDSKNSGDGNSIFVDLDDSDGDQEFDGRYKIVKDDSEKNSVDLALDSLRKEKFEELAVEKLTQEILNYDPKNVYKDTIVGEDKAKHTLILGALEGQSVAWREQISKISGACGTTIQTGNLIGLYKNHYLNFGVDSSGANNANNIFLARYFRHMLDHPNFLQLIGPNEIYVLNSKNKDLREGKPFMSGLHYDSLVYLWQSGAMRFAVADKGRLVTHAGLTYGLWVQLGRPGSAEETAELLNSLYKGRLLLSECLKVGSRPNIAADPVFAHPYMEFYPSWIMAPEAPPFGQVHASGSLNMPNAKKFFHDSSSPIRFVDGVQMYRWGSLTNIKGVMFTGVDLRWKPVIVPRIEPVSAPYIETTSDKDVFL